MNASLAAIRSQSQLYFMTTLEITSNAWIGLTDAAQEGNWQWKNGENTLVTDWGLNQPDGGVVENCTLLNVSDTYRWHDQPCSSINDYVCERGKVTINFQIILSFWGITFPLICTKSGLYTIKMSPIQNVLSKYSMIILTFS